MLFEREQRTGKSWHLFLQNVINNIIIQYIHQQKLKPIDAIKDVNAPDVKTNLILRSKFNRRYKDINVGDEVRVFKKKHTYTEMKEHVTNWTEQTYKVIYIDKSGLNGQVSFKLEGLNKSHFRNELLLVDDI